jgi:DNA uptake protein ComE-like DNA-binding protein
VVPKAKAEALGLLTDVLREAESNKGSVCSVVQKLARAAEIVGDQDSYGWCCVQLGDDEYTSTLKKIVGIMMAANNDKSQKEAVNEVAKLMPDLEKKGLKKETIICIEELNIKHNEGGGGYSNIGFVEDRYADLIRQKRGNDGTYYKANLNHYLSYVRKAAHKRATRLYSQLAYSDVPESAFDLLKRAIDDRLLDLSPKLAERLMAIFKAITSNKAEEWSQALTSCRRIIEGLADTLLPAKAGQIKGRALGQEQYINRLWAYMDTAIESETNKDLAKAHVDYLGSYLEKANKLGSKGVHADLKRIEAVKAVFHTYLVVADILDYVQKPHAGTKTAKNIHTASLDELESFLGISRQAAKEIVKLRVEKTTMSPEDLEKIKGIGAATISKAKEIFSFAPTEEK